MRSDGEIVIETRIDNSNVEQELQQTQAIVQKYQDKINEIINKDRDVIRVIHEGAGEYNVYEPLSEKELQQIKSIEAEMQPYVDKELELLDILDQRWQAEHKVTIEKQEQAMEEQQYAQELRQNIEQMSAEYNEIKKQKIIDDADIRFSEELKTNIIEAVDELEKLNGTRLHISGITDTNTELKEINDNVKKIHTSSNHTLRKLSKWGLAIIGVKTAYMGIRRIMNGVLANNKELSEQYSAMGQSFTNAFKPAVEKIINLIKTLMAYINVIWKAFFGKELFKNVVKSTEKTSKNLGSGAKSAKEINKQLASFDEANVLSADKSSGGGGGSGASADTGNVNLGLDKIKIPKWLEWIRDFIEKHPTLSKIIFGLAGFTLFGLFKKNNGLTSWIATLLGKKGGTAGAGGTGLLGLASTLAWLAGIVTIAIEIKILYDVFNKIDELKEDTIKAEKEVTSATEDSRKQNEKYNKSVVDKSKVEKLSNEEKKRTISHIKSTIETNNKYMENDKQMTGLFQHHAKLSNKARQEIETENRNMADTYYQLYKTGQLTADEEKDYLKFLMSDLYPGTNITTAGFKDMQDTLKTLQGKYGIEVLTEFKETGLSKIKDALGGIIEKLKGIFTNSGLGQLFSTIGDKYKNAFNNAKNSLSKYFKFADGGIVNLPGRGVPIAIGGEQGREGVIPMDNEAQMSLLGREIAKYVNINNVVNNYMDARKINSILQASANRERLANNG